MKQIPSSLRRVGHGKWIWTPAHTELELSDIDHYTLRLGELPGILQRQRADMEWLAAMQRQAFEVCPRCGYRHVETPGLLGSIAGGALGRLI